MSAERTVFRLSEVEVDPGGGYIRRNGSDQYLRPQTFAVLVHLLEHRDRVVPKEELWHAIWKDVAVSDDAIVRG